MTWWIMKIKIKFLDYLRKWVDKKINDVLKNLIDLKDLKESNANIRALAYQMYEKNGIVKKKMF